MFTYLYLRDMGQSFHNACKKASIFWKFVLTSLKSWIETHPHDVVLQKFISGWGPGGQKVNMTRNAVTIKHIPTSIVVRVHQSRLLQENIEIARERLKHAVDRHLNGENSYDAQLKRMELERCARNKRKRAAMREQKKMHAQERSNPEGDEIGLDSV
ncbi:unnamed protein product [Cercopithifilaria johnstoni]|uniref:Prokaryotic-type class I peptide chain release factors domain-containing protein n=1 Tax=Cercopithifilaria johnstoni TaxID=2874296 RepID=A0A8J2LYA4_9BILA|nr:unnamed protein product [Cercopithifilaria johnstoni]